MASTALSTVPWPVTRSTIGGRPVRTVGMDDVVGERGPIEGRPRSATVAATTHMTTWAISRDRLLAIVARNAALGAQLREEIARRYER